MFSAEECLWSYSEWTCCSTNSGEGTRSRAQTMESPEGKCGDVTAIEEESCNEENWGSCTFPCAQSLIFNIGEAGAQHYSQYSGTYALNSPKTDEDPSRPGWPSEDSLANGYPWWQSGDNALWWEKEVGKWVVGKASSVGIDHLIYFAHVSTLADGACPYPVMDMHSGSTLGPETWRYWTGPSLFEPGEWAESEPLGVFALPGGTGIK